LDPFDFPDLDDLNNLEPFDFPPSVGVPSPPPEEEDGSVVVRFVGAPVPASSGFTEGFADALPSIAVGDGVVAGATMSSATVGDSVVGDGVVAGGTIPSATVGDSVTMGVSSDDDGGAVEATTGFFVGLDDGSVVVGVFAGGSVGLSVTGSRVGLALAGESVMGWRFGLTLGEFVTGSRLGLVVGESVGVLEGESVGLREGDSVGTLEGGSVGRPVVGPAVGLVVGSAVVGRPVVGLCEGPAVGCAVVGSIVGSDVVGLALGDGVGLAVVGSAVGMAVGILVVGEGVAMVGEDDGATGQNSRRGGVVSSMTNHPRLSPSIVVTTSHPPSNSQTTLLLKYTSPLSSFANTNSPAPPGTLSYCDSIDRFGSSLDEMEGYVIVAPSYRSASFRYVESSLMIDSVPEVSNSMKSTLDRYDGCDGGPV